MEAPADLLDNAQFALSPEHSALLDAIDAFEKEFPKREEDDYSFYFGGEEGNMRVILSFKNQDMAREIGDSPQFLEFSSGFNVEDTNYRQLSGAAIQRLGEKAVSTLYGIPISTIFQRYTPLIEHIVSQTMREVTEADSTRERLYEIRERLYEIAHRSAHTRNIQPSDFLADIIDDTCYVNLRIDGFSGRNPGTKAERASKKEEYIRAILSGDFAAVTFLQDKTPAENKKLGIDLAIYLSLASSYTEPATTNTMREPPAKQIQLTSDRIRLVLAGATDGIL